MLYYDATNSLRAKTKSGLQRVAQRLRASLSQQMPLEPVVWSNRQVGFLGAESKQRISFGAGDCLLVPDLFSEEDRVGFGDFVSGCSAFTVAIFHDAIPLKFPEFTWPHSVRKHPRYMKDLARFDRVLAVSSQSRDELVGYWQWTGLADMPKAEVVPSGADIDADRPRNRTPRTNVGRQITQIGILEPRKNQVVSLAAARLLKAQGVDFELGFIGRVNPHYGKPIQQEIKQTAKAGVPVRYHGRLSDAEMAELISATRLTLLPSRAEGNGLPVLESLWQGLPVICSRLPVAVDWATGDAVRIVDPMTPDALAEAMREWLEDDASYQKAVQAACAMDLPTWEESATAIKAVVECGIAE
ncbi:MAG: glycosyltransferase [Verrucomicrobiota bacterium]